MNSQGKPGRSVKVGLWPRVDWTVIAVIVFMVCCTYQCERQDLRKHEITMAQFEAGADK